MKVITSPSAPVILSGLTTKYGLEYDRYSALGALAMARENAAITWRNRSKLPYSYPFWRSNALDRLIRCRTAVRKVEAELKGFSCG